MNAVHPSAALQSNDDARVVPSTLREFLLYFLQLGTFGFGGPIALAGYMQRDLVEDRKWISKQDYVEGLALAQLAPGPLAAQLAIYLGWVRAGVSGASLVAAAFVVPSFLMVLVLSAAYVAVGGLPWMQGLFYGIGAAVIAIIARSVVKLVKMSLAKDRLLWAIFIANAVTTAWTESEIVWIFLLSGILTLAVHARPRIASRPLAFVLPMPWLVSGLKGAASTATLVKIGVYFAEAGAFVFGSGLAIVPFLHGGVVDDFHWLSDRQFLDAVAVAMITPGPVVITVAFIGYLVAGPLGAVMAAIGVFLPCYLFVIVPAPYYKRIAGNRSIQAFVHGVTAAATGAIAGAGFVLGKRAIVDIPTAVILLVTLLVLTKLKKIPEPLVIVAAGLAGLGLAGCETAVAAGTSFVVPNGSSGVGFDDLRYSRSLHRVLVPSGRAGEIALLEPASGRMTAIEGFSKTPSYHGGHDFGVTSVDEGRGLLFATDRTAKKLDVIDPKERRAIASFKLAASPDYVRYVEATHEVWVTEPDAQQLEIISVSSDTLPALTRAATIRVDDGPESLVIDSARGRAYTHRWRGKTLAIDVHTRTIVGDWKNGCNASRGIELEPEHGFVFAACSEGRMTTLDALHEGKMISSLAEGSGYDVMGYNAQLRHAYLAGGKCGCMTTVAVTTAGELSKLGRVEAAKDTHCVVADDIGNAWVCEPSRGSLQKVSDPYPATR